MALQPLHYTISDTPRVAWTITQEKSVSHDFPLNTKNESCDDLIARTYFQFLWLPESIMPLGLLVPSLVRVHASIDATTPHPLHAMLERLLLTTRAVTNKYHVELPYILANGGGEGEEEESMMWFAVTHEKSDNNEEEPWLNNAWRSKWMDRMERREVQVQILLYMLKLSLPGPPPPRGIPSPSRKRRRLEKDPLPASFEDRLEAFMDKLSTWQLLSTLDEGLLRQKGDRDWIQVFCEDVVEPRFGTTVAAQTTLLRSKIFPHSPFSDSSDSEDERATSLDLHAQRDWGGSTSAPSRNTLEEPIRSRSRSLSVTLAEERDLQREGSVGARRRVLNREVSMKRAFKPRERDAKSGEAERKEREKAEEKQKAEEAKLAAIKERQGITLVAATPVKSKARSGTIKLEAESP
ncbi:hypothetical protein DFH07DRAFT_913719 [Mycena maculata]|uniref:DNA replication regulator Sld3 C-terminal domain-containing protein n=1 Tax=Mycena maculata TaxID=230809 RepID=A0AAD7JWA1_9AGAR|nr:hypothetical protein DFH07DRAFT_913719 [Mycena maculata]